VSSAMCEGIARAGNGLCLLAVSSESIVGKCARLFRAGRSSVLEDVSIDWGVPLQDTTTRFLQTQDLSNGGTVQISPSPTLQQTPHQIPTIDPGMRFIVFAITTHKTLPKHITVRGRLPGATTPFAQSVLVEYVKPFKNETLTVPLVHTLAARRLITDFEDDRAPLPTASPGTSVDDIRKAAIVRLGEEYQLASRHTSFVAVEATIEGRPPSRTGVRDLRGRSLRQRIRRPVNQKDASDQGSSSLIKIIFDGALAMVTYGMSYFQRGRSRGRLPRSIPGAFPSSRSPSPSPADTRDQSPASTLSSLTRSCSCSTWSSSRTPSPSPPQSEEEENVRSPSPQLESLHHAPEVMQRQHGVNEPSTAPDTVTAAGPVSPQIFDLVQLQSFDGSFPLSDDLGQIVGHDALGRAAEFQADEKTWATALAVAYFRKHLSKQPDLLEGLLEKAMEFVYDKANFDALVVHAKALVV